MITGKNNQPDIAHTVGEILAKDPGLSVKELAERLKTNRQFMAGVLKVLEQRGEVTCRQVGPARIYYVGAGTKGTSWSKK